MDWFPPALVFSTLRYHVGNGTGEVELGYTKRVKVWLRIRHGGEHTRFGCKRGSFGSVAVTKGLDRPALPEIVNRDYVRICLSTEPRALPLSDKSRTRRESAFENAGPHSSKTLLHLFWWHGTHQQVMLCGDVFQQARNRERSLPQGETLIAGTGPRPVSELRNPRELHARQQNHATAREVQLGTKT